MSLPFANCNPPPPLTTSAYKLLFHILLLAPPSHLFIFQVYSFPYLDFFFVYFLINRIESHRDCINHKLVVSQPKFDGDFAENFLWCFLRFFGASWSAVLLKLVCKYTPFKKVKLVGGSLGSEKLILFRAYFSLYFFLCTFFYVCVLSSVFNIFFASCRL